MLCLISIKLFVWVTWLERAKWENERKIGFLTSCLLMKVVVFHKNHSKLIFSYQGNFEKSRSIERISTFYMYILSIITLLVCALALFLYCHWSRLRLIYTSSFFSWRCCIGPSASCLRYPSYCFLMLETSTTE